MRKHLLHHSESKNLSKRMFSFPPTVFQNIRYNVLSQLTVSVIEGIRLSSNGFEGVSKLGVVIGVSFNQQLSVSHEKFSGKQKFMLFNQIFPRFIRYIETQDIVYVVFNKTKQYKMSKKYQSVNHTLTTSSGHFLLQYCIVVSLQPSYLRQSLLPQPF